MQEVLTRTEYMYIVHCTIGGVILNIRWTELKKNVPANSASSVADPGCLSRIPDVYPGFRILIFTHPGSRIPDPKTATKERGEKNMMSYLFCSLKFHKTENYFTFEMLKKKIWASFQRITELFTQKFVTKLSKIWVWDQTRSGIRENPDPESGSRDQKGTGSGSRIRIRNTEC
jgi:hypothetical protein